MSAGGVFKLIAKDGKDERFKLGLCILPEAPFDEGKQVLHRLGKQGLARVVEPSLRPATVTDIVA
jgi:hypothetical protein